MQEPQLDRTRQKLSGEARVNYNKPETHEGLLVGLNGELFVHNKMKNVENRTLTI